MNRTLYVVGIGPGGMSQLTLEAMAAMGEVDHWLAADKGERTADMVGLRSDLLAAYGKPGAQLIAVADPSRGPDAERDAAEYDAGVRDWHAARVARYADVISGLAEDDTVGFLVWGDPAFYDSTLRIVDQLRPTIDLTVHVIPGISAPQALAAAHQVPLNRIGEAIHITTGRRLLAEYHPGLGDVVVMLDGALACRGIVESHPDLELLWGAYLGSPRQVLRRGRLADIVDDVAALRADLRAQHGWIMDTYLLRPASA